MKCLNCQTPVKKEERGGWIHETGFYQCPGSRSEYDLAQPDLSPAREKVDHELMVDGQGI